MSGRDSVIVFWLMKCGETTWARDGRLRGVTDLPLSNSGRSTVSIDAGSFADQSITQVCHPSDEAASESARIVSEATGAKRRERKELADPDLGLLEGLTEQMFADRYAKRYKSWREDPLSLSPPEGENLIEARRRLFQEVVKQLRRSKGEIVFVLHDLALGLLRCWLTDQTGGELWSLVRDRPRVERYAMIPGDLEQLEESAVEVVSSN